MQDSPPPPTRAPFPASESRWKRGRPVASPRSSGDSRYSTSRLWVQDQPIRFAQSGPVALVAQQDDDQQSLTSQATPGFDKTVDVSKTALEDNKYLGPPRLLRFTTMAGKRGLHTTPAATRSEMAHQLHSSSSSSVNMCSAYDDGEEILGRKQQNAESNILSTNGHESETNSMTEHSNGSECVTGRDREFGSDNSRNAKDEEKDEFEQHMPLAFQIPDDVLRATMLASPNTKASYWSQTLYRGPENKQILTHYCQSPQVAERVARHFLNEKVVGFDIEWKPRANPASIKKNASLIQLACEDRIALFHISLFHGTSAKQLMPPTLKLILESPNIHKVGVAVKGDFSRLNKFLDIQAQGVFELSRLHNDVELHATEPDKVSNKLVSLAAQVLQHLQMPLYKGGPFEDQSLDSTNVRESDWSQPLDLQQIHYAAADAYAGFRLYHILDWKRKQLKPVPPRRGLCDFDSKPAPRTTDAQKRPRVARKPSDEKDVAVEQTAPVTEQEKEHVDEAEEEEYSTPEETIDTYQLGDRKPASECENLQVMGETSISPPTNETTQPEDNKVQLDKKLGRVGLSSLNDSDPGYPILPHSEYSDLPAMHEEINANLFRGRQLDGTSKPPFSGRGEVHEVNGNLFNDILDDAEDEFADPELEHALMCMYTDHNGDLTSDPRVGGFPSQTAVGKHQERNVSILNAVPKNKDVSASIQIEGSEPESTGYRNQDTTVSSPEQSSENDDAPEVETTLTSAFLPLTGQVDDISHIHEYNLATNWAQIYLHSTIPSPASKAPSRIRATIPHLRTYHMWHHQKLALDKVAEFLRDPPFSQSTVSSYILQAIALENLDYDKAAVRDVLMTMPAGLRRGRWKWLAQKVGALN